MPKAGLPEIWPGQTTKYSFPRRQRDRIEYRGAPREEKGSNPKDRKPETTGLVDLAVVTFRPEALEFWGGEE
jgi:hypothetical protein